MLHRIGFWWAVIVTVAVLTAGLGTAYTLNKTLMSTGGNVIGVGFGGIPWLFDGVKDGMSAGGNGKKGNNGPTAFNNAPVRANP